MSKTLKLPWHYVQKWLYYLFIICYLKKYRKGTFLVSYFSVQDLIWLFMQTPIYPELLQNYKHA